jgi:hypothetical protein
MQCMQCMHCGAMHFDWGGCNDATLKCTPRWSPHGNNWWVIGSKSTSRVTQTTAVLGYSRRIAKCATCQNRSSKLCAAPCKIDAHYLPRGTPLSGALLKVQTVTLKKKHQLQRRTKAPSFSRARLIDNPSQTRSSRIENGGSKMAMLDARSPILDLRSFPAPRQLP